MSQDRLFADVPNLYAYTKSNIDEMFSRYTTTNDLRNGFYDKAEVDTISSALQYEITCNYDRHQASMPLSAWVEKQIKDIHTTAVHFKGTKNSVDDLVVRWTENLDRPEDRPKIGDIWLVKSSRSPVVGGTAQPYDEYICNGEGGDGNVHTFTWELVGNIANFELSTFYTRDEADYRFAQRVNGILVEEGAVVISTDDIPGIEDYALVTYTNDHIEEARLSAYSQIEKRAREVSGQTLEIVETRLGEVSGEVNELTDSKILAASGDLVAYTDQQDQAFDAVSLGRDEFLSGRIDAINKELENELTYKEYLDKGTVVKGLDRLYGLDETQKLLGDVMVVKSTVQNFVDSESIDVNQTYTSYDVYLWTGEPNGVEDSGKRGWKLFGPIAGNELSANFATKKFTQDLGEINLVKANQYTDIASSNVMEKMALSAALLDSKIDEVEQDLSGAVDRRLEDHRSSNDQAFLALSGHNGLLESLEGRVTRRIDEHEQANSAQFIQTSSYIDDLMTAHTNAQNVVFDSMLNETTGLIPVLDRKVESYSLSTVAEFGSTSTYIDRRFISYDVVQDSKFSSLTGSPDGMIPSLERELNSKIEADSLSTVNEFTKTSSYINTLFYEHNRVQDAALRQISGTNGFIYAASSTLSTAIRDLRDSLGGYNEQTLDSRFDEVTQLVGVSGDYLNDKISSNARAAHNEVVALSTEVYDRFYTKGDIDGAFRESIESWVESQIDGSIISLLKFKEVFTGRLEDLNSALTQSQRRVGDVYLVKEDGSSECREYLVKSTEGGIEDFELIGTVDFATLDAYCTDAELSSKLADALRNYATSQQLGIVGIKLNELSGEVNTLRGTTYTKNELTGAGGILPNRFYNKDEANERFALTSYVRGVAQTADNALSKANSTIANLENNYYTRDAADAQFYSQTYIDNTFATIATANGINAKADLARTDINVLSGRVDNLILSSNLYLTNANAAATYQTKADASAVSDRIALTEQGVAAINTNLANNYLTTAAGNEHWVMRSELEGLADASGMNSLTERVGANERRIGDLSASLYDGNYLYNKADADQTFLKKTEIGANIGNAGLVPSKAEHKALENAITILSGDINNSPDGLKAVDAGLRSDLNDLSESYHSVRGLLDALKNAFPRKTMYHKSLSGFSDGSIICSDTEESFGVNAEGLSLNLYHFDQCFTVNSIADIDKIEDSNEQSFKLPYCDANLPIPLGAKVTYIISNPEPTPTTIDFRIATSDSLNPTRIVSVTVPGSGDDQITMATFQLLWINNEKTWVLIKDQAN